MTMTTEEIIKGFDKMYPAQEWQLNALRCTKSSIKTRSCSYDDQAYRSGEHPFQVVIQASGWRAHILAFLFRIKPCYFTDSKVLCWPRFELLK